MKTEKKETKILKNDTLLEENIIQSSRKTLLAAKDWLLDDGSLLSAYWHEKMGYMEAWVTANWNLVLEKGQDALDELDELEDLSLLWLVDHANNNPVPLKDCHVVGSRVEPNQYRCMACSNIQVLKETAELRVCNVCGYGVFSTHVVPDK